MLKIETNAIVLRLKKRQHITLRHPRGLTVRCLSGTGLWVTQDGDTKDYPLRAGEALTFSTRRVGYIQLLEDAVVAISSPTRFGRAATCQIFPP
jgi:DUF2917 family protein